MLFINSAGVLKIVMADLAINFPRKLILRNITQSYWAMIFLSGSSLARLLAQIQVSTAIHLKLLRNEESLGCLWAIFENIQDCARIEFHWDSSLIYEWSQEMGEVNAWLSVGVCRSFISPSRRLSS
jgi:hypothetical protein